MANTISVIFNLDVAGDGSSATAVFDLAVVPVDPPFEPDVANTMVATVDYVLVEGPTALTATGELAGSVLTITFSDALQLHVPQTDDRYTCTIGLLVTKLA